MALNDNTAAKTCKISEPERDKRHFSIGLNGCLGHVDAHRRHDWRDWRVKARVIIYLLNINY